MSQPTGTTRRSKVMAAAVLIAVTVIPVAEVGAAPQGGRPPTVSVSAADGSFVSVVSPCDAPSTTISTPGSFTLERDAGVAGDVVVDVTYGGSLAGSPALALPDPVLIPSGQASVDVAVASPTEGDLSLSIEPGPGYTTGDPSAATVTITGSGVVGNCPAEIRETIEVGTLPSPFDAVASTTSYDVDMDIEGELPPGVNVGFDGTFAGAATEVGVFPFVVRYRTFGLIILEQPFEITVVPAGVEPPTPTEPADPGPGPATVGAAAPATAVGGQPTFTG